MFMPRPLKPPARTFQTSTFWHWKPSKRLRDEGGFRTVALGEDMRAAFAQARTLNKQADTWLASAGTTRRAKPKADAPEHPGGMTFGQLVARYKASHHYTSKRASTRKTYNACIAILEREFADDRLESITRGRVRDWADPLRTSAPQGLRHYATLAHTMVEWAREGEIVALKRNPFDKVKIAPNRRKMRILEDDLKWLVALADARGRTDIGTAMVLAFFCVQRLYDVLSLTTANITRKGAKQGLVLHQSKTKASIELPTLPQPVAQRLRMHPAVGGWLCARLLVDAKGKEVVTPLTEQTAQKSFATLRRAAEAAAIKEEGPNSPRAERLKGLQMRDMRRSGFVFYASGKKDARGRVTRQPVPVSAICAMSGHKIDEGTAIVETYLPKTPEQADMAVAMAGAKW